MFTPLALYPFIERLSPATMRSTMCRPPAQRPDPDRSRRAGDLVLLILPAGGANDVIAFTFNLPSTRSPGRSGYHHRGPPAYVVTKRICLGLQRRDRELLHGLRPADVRLARRDRGARADL
jgi:ubiquinol-cytochrome c reductase cytochrome b subunit